MGLTGLCPPAGEDGLGMDVAGTQLVEKDIENLARGEEGARPAAGRGLRGSGPRRDGAGEPVGTPRPLPAARGICVFYGSD